MRHSVLVVALDEARGAGRQGAIICHLQRVCQFGSHGAPEDHADVNATNKRAGSGNLSTAAH